MFQPLIFQGVGEHPYKKRPSPTTRPGGGGRRHQAPAAFPFDARRRAPGLAAAGPTADRAAGAAAAAEAQGERLLWIWLSTWTSRDGGDGGFHTTTTQKSVLKKT